MSGYMPVAIFTALIIGFGVVSLAAAWLLRPARPDPVKLANYECGAEPIGSAWVQFPVGAGAARRRSPRVLGDGGLHRDRRPGLAVRVP